MLASLCREYTQLSDSDIKTLELIAATLPHICKLVESDIFIDCFYQNYGKCLVVAEARPPGGVSVYKESVVGKFVLPEKEPAVFRAMETGLPVRDILGITQENRTVWQVVIPIKNAGDALIGVLIQEKDISAKVSRDKKYEELVQIIEKQKEKLHHFQDTGTAFMPEMDDNHLAMKEIHHRVKNNLQLVASMLNLHARRTEVPEIQSAFRENVSRILSIAAIYDALSLGTGPMGNPREGVALAPMLRKVCQNVMSCSSSGECRITINVDGDDFRVDHDKATYIALVVNELVMNAVEHAFIGRPEGNIQVAAKKGVKFSSVAVVDNGGGFAADWTETNSLGMSIVRSLVKEKLRGKLAMETDNSGSRLSIDFEN